MHSVLATGAAALAGPGCDVKGWDNLGAELAGILKEGRLKACFQPIYDLATGEAFGFEGLIRGPSDSILHSPLNLFSVAKRMGYSIELERLCCRTLLEAFAAQESPHRLFLNISPEALALAPEGAQAVVSNLSEFGLEAGRVIIELTESQPIQDYAQLLEAAERYRRLGFAIALDDLGEGFSSLRLWSEIHPEYVKVDKHFVQGVSQDPLKHRFFQSIHEIAKASGARVVAEGLETEADLVAIQELGIEFAQGYFLARPGPTLPVGTPHPALKPKPVGDKRGSAVPGWMRQNRVTAGRLRMDVAPLPPETPNDRVADRFTREPGLRSIPVVADGRPVGLLNRYAFMDLMVKPFSRELYGKRPCSLLMDPNPLVVDRGTSLHELSTLVVESDPRHILHGFVITQSGAYAGMGSGHDLMREITRLQINAARYANPLTGLPGNVPIQEHLEELLEAGQAFVVAYCDLDHFKPYNDVHGYRKGDEVLHWTGRLLASAAAPVSDFLGHIGGDDFILVFRSRDWEQRCLGVIEQFQAEVGRFFGEEDVERGGYTSEDRVGRMVFHPLLSLSIGVVRVAPGSFLSHHEIAAAAAAAKREAKKRDGCTLFVERRSAPAEPVPGVGISDAPDFGQAKPGPGSGRHQSSIET